MAEGQAKAGHDIMGLRTWSVSAQAENSCRWTNRPAGCRRIRHGREASEYSGKIDGHWMAVPTSYGSSYAAALRPHRLYQGICRSTYRRCTRPALRPTRS